MDKPIPSTEAVNPRTQNMDTLDVADLVRLLHDESMNSFKAVEVALPQIAIAVEVITAKFKEGGRLFYIGAGTSGRLGVLDASECPPTFGVANDLVVGIIAGGDKALRESIEGAEDDETQGAADLEKLGITPKDVVIGIAASGNTPYVIGALVFAEDKGAVTIAIVCNSGSKMIQIAKHTILLETGPEPLTGSTRMHAGTATKLALNMISTVVMIKLGKTYGNLMVDVQATNEKLEKRAARIVQTAADCSEAEAQDALEQANGECKIAIVMLRRSVSADEARALLVKSNGFVRKALED